MALYRGDPKILESLHQTPDKKNKGPAATAATAANGVWGSQKAAKQQMQQGGIPVNINLEYVPPLHFPQKSSKAANAARGISCKKSVSPLSIIRRAGLVPVLAGDSFEVLGLENLPDDRRERCRQYCREHEREILQELRDEAWFRGGFHLSWLRDAGLELSWDGVGQVEWEILPEFRRIWRIVDHAFICWRYACEHRREIMAALQPCRGWKPDKPSGGCTTLEEFNKELEKERRRGVVMFCPFHDMWLLRKDCPRWCVRWNEPLTDAEREYWGALWKDGRPDAA